MKKLLSGIFYSLLLIPFSYGQVKLYPLSQPVNGVSARIEQTVTDTIINLPFWEDFSKTKTSIDTLKWSEFNGVQVNNTYSINAPSVYQLVFDGVDGNGNAYSENTIFNGEGDYIISQSINLSRVPQSRRNSVYMSFFYQLKGLGELPEEMDSLTLEFFRSDSTWVTVDINPRNPDALGLRGGTDLLNFDEDSVLAYNQISVQIGDPAFFHQNFRFKFTSYSSLSGVYDAWIIDYIYINQDRTSNELQYRDRTISSQPSALFYPYRAVPADRFRRQSNLFDVTQKVNLANLEPGVFLIEFNHILENEISGRSASTGLKNDDGEQGFRGIEFDREISGLTASSLEVEQDCVIISSEFYYNTGDTILSEDNSTGFITYYPEIDLRINDTIRDQYVLKDYYAYDDGTAEFAAGINLQGGKVAVEFSLDETDTLTGVEIYFPQINPTTAGEAIDIKIWQEIGDNSEQEVLIKTQQHIISYDGINVFNTVEFTPPLLVTDTFFIGFTQFTDNFIGVGFDKNSPAGSERIYSNTDRTWQKNNRITGAMMMRPIFGKAGEVMLAREPRFTPELKVYPNPTDGIVEISKRYDSIAVFDMSGQRRLIFNSNQNVNLSSLPDGIYFLKIRTENHLYTRKIIKK